MESIDIIMNATQIQEALDKAHSDGTANNTLDIIKRAQAEISFNAGREAGYQQGLNMKPNPDGVYDNGKRDGMQKVVDWIRENHEDISFWSMSLKRWTIVPDEWQAFLKEHGLDKARSEVNDN